MTEIRLTADRLEQLQQCFEHALELDAGAREEYLTTIAATDADLAHRARGLLLAHHRTGRSLESPISHGTLDYHDPTTDHLLGVRVGAYEVVRRIGSGGMGTVYEAIRADDHYSKRVAIKFLRHQAAGEETLRRFRDERQILASLDHPNIAALLDGGVTVDNQPYFVMDYIEGEPITQWCNARKLGITGRLDLFQQICAAVQYAHQSLVVHRDLKPGNILVTDAGAVKLLDFGIAKLLRPENDIQSDDPDLPVTKVGARAYTPEYASPEQILGLPVGTRSDVYALGVVLYELLTGVLPFELTGKSAGDIEHVVSEIAPTKPSNALPPTRAAQLAERSPAAARARLGGDLDAIVLMALRKEPARRYGSAEDFAADVRRYLQRRPVLARPEGIGYRFGRLVRRHRLETAAIAIAVLSLVGGLWMTSEKAAEASKQRERATAVKSFLATMLNAANPASFGRDVQVRVVLDSAAIRADSLRDQPGLESEIREIIGGTYLALGEFEQAETQFRRGLAANRAAAPGGDRATAAALGRLSSALEFQGRYADADSVLQESLALFQRFAPENDPAQATLLDARGRMMVRLGRMSDAEPLLKQALAVELQTMPVNDSARAYYYANLGMVTSELGRHAEAESLLTIAVATAKRAHGDPRPLVASILSPLASVQEWAGHPERAESTYIETLRMRRELLGPEHPDYAWTMFNYADHLLRVERYPEAADWARQVLALRGKSLTDDHPAVATAMGLLGRALDRMDSLEAGGQWLRESWQLRQRTLPDGHYLIASAESILGEHFVLTGDYAAAEQHLLAGERDLLASRSEDAPIMQDSRKRIVKLYEAWGKPDEAAAWRAKLHE